MSHLYQRPFRLTGRKQNVPKCPKCSNHEQFVFNSLKVSEDGCEVWITCKCGFDPHDARDRMESVMGACTTDNIYVATSCWADAVKKYNDANKQ